MPRNTFPPLVYDKMLCSHAMAFYIYDLFINPGPRLRLKANYMLHLSEAQGLQSYGQAQG